MNIRKDLLVKFVTYPERKTKLSHFMFACSALATQLSNIFKLNK